CIVDTQHWRAVAHAAAKLSELQIRSSALSNEVLRRVLMDVANELRDKGALDEAECFIDAMFVMAKGGGVQIGPTKRGKGMKIIAILAMRAQPAFASAHSSLRHWLATLDRLEELKPVIIVPSHGPTGDGTGFITGYRAYLTEVRDRTGAQKRTGSRMDQAVGADPPRPLAHPP